MNKLYLFAFISLSLLFAIPVTAANAGEASELEKNHSLMLRKVYVSSSSDKEIVQLLLDANADPEQPDDQGIRPLVYLMMQYPTSARFEVIELLKSKPFNNELSAAERVFVKKNKSILKAIMTLDTKEKSLENRYEALQVLAERAKDPNISAEDKELLDRMHMCFQHKMSQEVREGEIKMNENT